MNKEGVVMDKCGAGRVVREVLKLNGINRWGPQSHWHIKTCGMSCGTCANSWEILSIDLCLMAVS